MTDRNPFDTLRENPFEENGASNFPGSINTDAFEEDEDETCEHGLSAWLCAGPFHYPEGM